SRRRALQGSGAGGRLYVLEGDDLVLPVVLGDEIDLDVLNVRPVLQRLVGEAKDGLVSRPRRDAPPLAPVVGVREAGRGLTLAVHEQLREAPGPVLARGELRNPAFALARLPAGDCAATTEDGRLIRVGGVDNALLGGP